MAEPFEVGIGDLVAEFFAHTLSVLVHFPSAGTISVAAGESLFDDFYDLFVRVQRDLHKRCSFFFQYITKREKEKKFSVKNFFSVAETKDMYYNEKNERR